MRCFLLVMIFSGVSVVRADDPLKSWNDGASKSAILNFVASTTDASHPHYVLPENRIAVFDNDGTLWSEQPAYFQLLFALDRIKALAAEHPEWKTEQPFQAVLEDDLKAVAASGTEGLMKLVAVSHTGMTTDQFSEIVRQWISTARHPQKNVLYSQLVFQPMLELLEYLRKHEFKTYIVSGGGIDFMRVFAQEVYGIPPEQVIGSSIVTHYEIREGIPVLTRQPELDFNDDKEGKPIAIHRFIGRRPIAAFGNSDGDLQMLQWTAAGSGNPLCVIVHHTDADREWAYDRDSHIGRLDKALDQAVQRQWIVIDMKQDWNPVYPLQK